MSAQRQQVIEDSYASSEEDVQVEELSPEEAWDLFDRASRRELHISGREFLQQWDAGAFRDDPDQPGLMGVVMLIPLVR